MKNLTISRGIIAAALFALPVVATAQCNVFVKKKCMPRVAPFTNNGQMNTSTLTAGGSTSMNLTFYSGQDYRILVCSEASLGTVSFKVMDETRKVIWESKDHDDADFWDFKARSTQQLIVEVKAPPSESASSVLPTGCVSVMVGFKKE